MATLTGFTATGGTLTTLEQNGIVYNVHTFTSSGQFQVDGSIDAQFLVVAGGGSGGNHNTTNGNGGGGAGGVLYSSNISLTGNISVVVGAGGAAVANATIGIGNKGNNSSLGTYIAQGGGGGGTSALAFNASLQNGGSTGGAANGTPGTGTTTQTTYPGVTAYGNRGGTSGVSWTGAGGGGAGSVGVNGATSAPGGNGGQGQSFDISGQLKWYAGGGGGGGNSSERAGDGFHGGGRGYGTTSYYNFNVYPNEVNSTTLGSSTPNAVVNTGGGGGGGSYWAPNGGWTTGSGTGGSGVVIIRYATIDLGTPIIVESGNQAVGGTESVISTASGVEYKIHTFTSSGTLNVTDTVSFEFLVVAGGGSGGNSNTTNGNGGGGAGGALYSPNISLTGNISVVVGAGGAAVANATVGIGNKGNNSSLGSYVAQGGGGGGTTAVSFNSSLQNGGSTGGAANGTPGTGTTTQTTYPGVTAYGNRGGTSGVSWTGAGGGGAGSVGVNGATSAPGGNGGQGQSFEISGQLKWYAGGGGGGGNSSERAGDGFHGGGRGFGTTSYYSNSSYPVGINSTTLGSSTLNAVINTGGGGGGGSYWAPNGGWTTGSGTGGSGVVIARYPFRYQEIVNINLLDSVTLNGFLANPGVIPVKAYRGVNVSYSISPTLPQGLLLDTATGTINGQPVLGSTSITDQQFTVTTRSNLPIDDSVSNTFNLTTITTTEIIATVTSPSVTINRYITNPGIIPVTFSGAYGNVIYSISPALPAGLKFNSVTSEITGQPTEPSTGDYAIFQLDFFGNTGSGSFTLTTTTALTNPISATGGIETTIELNNAFYKAHIFTESGVFNVTQQGLGVVEYLVIGGGGGGGSDMGGGGGGGGYLAGAAYPIEVGNYVVTVGAGGTGAPAGTDQVRANSGGNSKLYPALLTELSIALIGFSQSLGNAVDGLATFNTNGTAYSTYNNLPSYLTGLLATTSYNDGDTTRFTTNKATRVYLMRNSSYGAVDLTGWTEIESGKPYQTGVDMFVYYRDFTAGGPYNIDSSGAFYLFEDFDAAIIAAYGGGGGASDHTGPTSVRAAVAGGSGGGASGNNSNRGLAYPGQGYAGANSIGSWYPGGGGGAGAVGSVNPANGGAGVANSILGTNYFWAGGGGGAGYTGQPGNGGAGGGGGGAPRQATQGFGDTLGFNAGQNATPGGLSAAANVPGGAGGASTGGGGGGGAHFTSNNFGGNGGSGIVVIRYAINPPPVEAVATIYSKTITKFENTNFRPVLPIKGEAPFIYSVVPALPTGLTLNSATGYITGTPSEPATEKQYTMFITDSVSNIASATFLLTTSLSYLSAIDLVVNRTLFIQTVEAISESDRTVSDINPALISINVDDSVTGNKNLKYGVVATVLVNQDYQLSTQVNVTDAAIVNVDHSFENFISLNNNLKFKFGQLDAEVTQYVLDSQAFLSPGTFSWTVPEGVTDINVVAIGGGGGGTQKVAGGSGGGGGAISYVNKVTVTPGEIFDIVIGTGGAASTDIGQNGNATYMSSQGTLNYVLYAPGGQGADQFEWSVTTHTAVFPDVSGTTFNYSVANFGAFTYTLTDAPPGFAINSGTGTVTYTKQFITAQSSNELTVTATAPNGTAITRTDIYLVNPDPIGQQEYTTAGTFIWTVPLGVTQVSAVCIGGGGGGLASTSGGSGGAGGNLRYGRIISVTPGETLTVIVGAAGTGGTSTQAGGATSISRGGTALLTAAGGGQGTTTTPAAQNGASSAIGGNIGGGNGGRAQTATTTANTSGGGGAGGYSGNGGDGGVGAVAGTSGAGGGGGGGGGNGSTLTAGNGGGVGIFGQGLDGTGGSPGGAGNPGSGGSGITFGGAGRGADNSTSSNGAPGSRGAVRIIWGFGRVYPSTRTANE